jgi:hypothetical protein
MDASKPQPPLHYYLRFRNERFDTLKSKTPDMNSHRVSKVLAEAFKNLSLEEQNRYKAEYQKEVEIYKEEIRKYNEAHGIDNNSAQRLNMFDTDYEDNQSERKSERSAGRNSLPRNSKSGQKHATFSIGKHFKDPKEESAKKTSKRSGTGTPHPKKSENKDLDSKRSHQSQSSHRSRNGSKKGAKTLEEEKPSESLRKSLRRSQTPNLADSKRKANSSVNKQNQESQGKNTDNKNSKHTDTKRVSQSLNKPEGSKRSVSNKRSNVSSSDHKSINKSKDRNPTSRSKKGMEIEGERSQHKSHRKSSASHDKSKGKTNTQSKGASRSRGKTGGQENQPNQSAGKIIEEKSASRSQSRRKSEKTEKSPVRGKRSRSVSNVKQNTKEKSNVKPHTGKKSVSRSRIKQSQSKIQEERNTAPVNKTQNNGSSEVVSKSAIGKNGGQNDTRNSKAIKKKY